ncbi:MAG: DEAD/DEAH box helicase [Gammaproteobacteria bacterium]|nr:DEAD/DEAH box helicase [Gammaproteobacteria bacterium]
MTDKAHNNLSTLFSQFNIHQSLQDAIIQKGWDDCTPIQAKTLPLTLTGHDVAGKAQTGTGKTAAFLIAIYHYLMTNPVKPNETGPWAIILAPTRELASQIYEDALQIGCYTGLKPVAIYGGKDYEEQKAQFTDSQPDIVIGTPGRIIDLYKQRYFDLKNIECLVLDEADRMFDLGFISDIRYLMRGMPPANERLNLIFSATFTYRVQELAYEYLNAPIMVEVESEKETAEHIKQVLYHVANNEKTPLLIGQLQKLNHDNDKAIVFLNTKHVLERLAHTLEHNGFKVAMLSGDIPQHKRERLLKAFQNGEKNILLATDVAARGLHIDDISHVFNYDLPQQPEDYIHRVGRTARAGKAGSAISFGCEDFAYHLPEIEEKLGEKIPTESITDDMLADVIPAPEFIPQQRQNQPKARNGNQKSAKYENKNGKKNSSKPRTRSPYNRKRNSNKQDA